ncbi:MAG: YbjN domain-containing protein [Actinomycetota bacterium]|nr:YbjN domain-containing protein [Actinomycetota bacterium]
MGPGSAQQSAADVVEGWFAAHHDLEVERVGGRGWLTVLRGERKRTIPVHLDVGAHVLAVQSFFMRAPDENEAATYAFLLRRNLRTYVLRFALSAEGDVLLLGVLPLHAVTAEELDRMLGQLLSAADDAFEPALRIGFESYIEREQAWRARLGAGGAGGAGGASGGQGSGLRRGSSPSPGAID